MKKNPFFKFLNLQVGHTDCRGRFFRAIGIPHKFVLVRNSMKIYELLNESGRIKINVDNFHDWVKGRRIEFKEKFLMRKTDFENVIKKLKELHGKRYTLFFNNCYFFVNEIKKLAVDNILMQKNKERFYFKKI